MPYQIFIKSSAQKESTKIPKDQKELIRNEIKLLAINPRPDGVKKLKGLENFYRIRIGDYRVIYTIDDPHKVVRVLSVLHREEAYR